MRRKGNRHNPGSAHGLRGPQAGPLAPPPRPSLSLVEHRHPFGTCFGGLRGYLRPRAKTMISHAQGGTKGVWGSKGAVQGPPMDHSDGPIAGLVERNTFVWTPVWAMGLLNHRHRTKTGLSRLIH